ncbi:MAG: ROK family protein [Clostridia bacterium]|nr:ROK family protein [Clostridia bacterium]
MYRIGVDLGGTNIAAGLVDENYNIIKKASVPTNASRGADAIVADISALCLRLCDEGGVSVSDIDAIGIASPGIANHTDGYVEYANNLPFKHLPICEMVSKGTGVKEVHVENDANAAAWGEAVAGAAKGTENSVMITLGTGVGGGIIIDGKVYSGFNYAGAELGHIVIEHNGRPCSCGRKGCWEAYSSATGLIKMTKEKLEECANKGETTVMTELVEKKGKVTGRTAFDAMRLGDKAGKEVVDMYLDYLACGLASIINIFQPSIITIGGGISGEGQSLIDALEPLVRAEQYGCGLVKLTEIRIAKLGNDAGIIGAAFLGI